MNLILELKKINKDFILQYGGLFRRKKIHPAVRDVNLKLYQGESLGIVGESGCGKSTLAKMIMGLHEPTSGEIFFGGKPHRDWLTKNKLSLCKKVQMVFQDPTGSLNPRHTIADILHLQMRRLTDWDKYKRDERIKEIFDQVQISVTALPRYPHEFSGGQAQRISIARALLAHPEILVLDEPVSALDVSVQAQILQLLENMRKELKLSYVFISHDLAVVEQLCPRVMVMFFGRVVEQGKTNALFRSRSHPYTDLLLKSVPTLQQNLSLSERNAIEEITLSGCAFQKRCIYAQPACEKLPELRVVEESQSTEHLCACHFPLSKK